MPVIFPQNVCLLFCTNSSCQPLEKKQNTTNFKITSINYNWGKFIAPEWKLRFSDSEPES